MDDGAVGAERRPVATDRGAVFRVLDANANRAVEGLRTVEEFARMVLGDALLSERLKRLRHDVAALVGRFPRHELLAARDTPGDVGTRITAEAETRRAGPLAVALAGCGRVLESLRCLEEYGKTVDGRAAAGFERLRYEAYAVFAAVERVHLRSASVERARLYVLVACGTSALETAEHVARLAEAGADAVQLRDKRADDRRLFEHAEAAAAAARRGGSLFFVNDRADIAVACGADGVHVGQDELPVAAVRRVVGPDRLVGVSTHDIEQARAAVLAGADYLGAGPTFPSATKRFAAFPGLPFLRAVAREITLPTFAIGGIDLRNVAEVVEAGVRRIAVSGAVSGADDPRAAVQRLRDALEEGGQEERRKGRGRDGD